MTPVGFIGLGVMGAAMSGNLITSGRSAVGFDIDPERMRLFAQSSGLIAADAAAVAGRADVIITSLPDASALAQTATAIAAAGRSVIVVETSTLSLADKSAARAVLAPAGVTLLDCPVSGTGQQARDGDLVAYLSGDDDDLKAVAAKTMEPFMRRIVDVGGFGNGSRMKFVANLLVAVHNASAAEALLLADRAGLRLDQVIDAVGDGAGGSRMLQVRGPLMARRAFDEATATVATMEKDLGLICSFAQEVQSPTPLLTTTAELYGRAIAQGWYTQDSACVFAVLEQLFPVAQR